jgi:hypothetical protein
MISESSCRHRISSGIRSSVLRCCAGVGLQSRQCPTKRSTRPPKRKCVWVRSARARCRRVNAGVMPEKLKQVSLSAAVTTLALLGLYAAALYLRVATASINDSYQPGIEAIQIACSPGIVLALTLAEAAWTKSATVARLCTMCCVGALAVCGVMLIVVNMELSTAAWQFAQERTLTSTLRRALFTPSFSNRSAVWSAVFAAIMLRASLWLSHKLHNKALQPTRETRAAEG